MEMSTIIAKVVYRYDLELVDDKLDWLRDSRMHTLWNKPPLKVRVKPRSDKKEN